MGAAAAHLPSVCVCACSLRRPQALHFVVGLRHHIRHLMRRARQRAAITSHLESNRSSSAPAMEVGSGTMMLMDDLEKLPSREGLA